MAGNTVSVRLFWADGYAGEFDRRGNACGMALRTDGIVLFVVRAGVLVGFMASDARKTVIAVLEAFAFC